MMFLLTVLVFAAAGMIKGGWLGRIPGWNTFAHRKERSNIVFEYLDIVKAWLFDGTQLSPLLVFVFLALVQPNLLAAGLFAACWWLFVMTSMGEEAGAAGDYKGAWGDYMEAIYPPGHKKAGEAVFGRSCGIKKGIIYGLAGGGMLGAVSGIWALIPICGLFPLIYFIGNSIHRAVHKQSGWAYSEPLYFGTIGATMGFYLA